MCIYALDSQTLLFETMTKPKRGVIFLAVYKKKTNVFTYLGLQFI